MRLTLIIIICFLSLSIQAEDALVNHGYFSESEKKAHRKLEGSNLDKTIEDYSKTVNKKISKEKATRTTEQALKAVIASSKLKNDVSKASSLERSKLISEIEKTKKKNIDKQQQKTVKTSTKKQKIVTPKIVVRQTKSKTKRILTRRR